MKGRFWKPNRLFERTLKNAAEVNLHEFIDPGNYVRGTLKRMLKVNITGEKFYSTRLGRWKVEIPGRHTKHELNVIVALAETESEGELDYVSTVYLTAINEVEELEAKIDKMKDKDEQEQTS